MIRLVTRIITLNLRPNVSVIPCILLINQVFCVKSNKHSVTCYPRTKTWTILESKAQYFGLKIYMH